MVWWYHGLGVSWSGGIIGLGIGGGGVNGGMAIYNIKVNMLCGTCAVQPHH
jgi:hypothetical protein